MIHGEALLIGFIAHEDFEGFGEIISERIC